MKKLRALVKEAAHKYSLFGKGLEVADRRRHAFNKRVIESKAKVEVQLKYIETLKKHKDDFGRIENEEQILQMREWVLTKMLKKRNFWRARAVQLRERHSHWGSVIKHRRDRLRWWIAQHETFQPYMANGKPWEKLTPEARHYIYLDFREGLYVTSTYEGHPGDGVHATSSYHYIENQPDGRARCWDAGSTSLGKMESAQRRQAGKRTAPYLTEMFGPVNDLAYKNGMRETLAEGSELETMHDNHVHTDIRDGAPK